MEMSCDVYAQQNSLRRTLHSCKKKRTANSAMRAKLAEKGHVKPGAFSVSHEKLLIGVATKGVVKLFNDVKGNPLTVVY